MKTISLTVVHALAAKGYNKVRMNGAESHDIPLDSISSLTDPSNQEQIDHQAAFGKIHLKPNTMFLDGRPIVSILVLQGRDEIRSLIEKSSGRIPEIH